MIFLNVIYQNGIWLSIPLFLVSAGSLIFFVRSIVRLDRASHITDLPLIGKQTVQFIEAGKVALSLEAPRLSERFSELEFELISADGKRISGRNALLHSRSSGMSTVKMELLVFNIPTPGQYVLQIKDLGAATGEDQGIRIIFSRPHIFQTVGFILGIVLSAGMLIGSIVLFILSLVNKGTA